MKVNNKGFAITTLIYGLAILALLLIVIIMATLSSMRSNIKEMANQVENELISQSISSVEYSKTDITNNVFTTPINGTGFYRIEVWSPPNGSGQSTYATGVIRLDEKEKIYIYRGDQGAKKHVYLLGVEPGLYDMYTTDFYDTTFRKTALILYADEDGAKMNGSTDEESRKLFYDYRHAFSEYEMRRYAFINTRIIKNIPVDPTEFPNGKVLINRLFPDSNHLRLETANSIYWNLSGVYVGVSGAYDMNNPCSLYITHDRMTTCFTLSNVGDGAYNYVHNRCKNDRPDMSKMLYSTGVDGYSAVEPTDDMSLICPSVAYENTTFDIYVSSGQVKKSVEQHKDYTTVYNGKYKHHDGTGIKMTPYQPDSIADKIDNGNFYLLAFNNEKYALTTMPDGSSVSMKGLTGSNTQKWEISKIKNYNVTKHQFTSEEYNYLNHPAGTDLIDKTFKIVELSTFKALDIKYDENIACNKISAQYTFNPLSFNEPQIWRLIPNSDGSYSIKTIINSTNGDENVGYLTYKLSGEDSKCSKEGIDVGDVYISAMEGGELKDNQKFTLFLYDYNNLSETK